MTTIVVTHEDNEVDQFTFDASDHVISIGRRSTNDVCIPNLSVSGMHARITIDGDSVLIEDNSSTNGTYVNGRLISRQLLNKHDEVVVGKSRLVILPTPVQSTQTKSTQNQPTQAQHSQAQESQVHTDKAVRDTGLSQAAPSYDDPAHLEPPLLNNVSDLDQEANSNINVNQNLNLSVDNNNHEFMDELDDDDSFVGDARVVNEPDDQFDDRPMSLSEKAKLALGRESQGRESYSRGPDARAPQQRSVLNGVATTGAVAAAATSATAAASRAFASDGDTALVEPETRSVTQHTSSEANQNHPLDGLDNPVAEQAAPKASEVRSASPVANEMNINADAQVSKPAGAVIEIQNGAKSGQVLPIDKPVTTLGRPGIQIAAIMRKPDGYFLMHIESDDSVDMPTLNRDTIGDDPVMLHSGDRLNVAGIDVEFMLS